MLERGSFAARLSKYCAMTQRTDMHHVCVTTITTLILAIADSEPSCYEDAVHDIPCENIWFYLKTLRARAMRLLVISFFFFILYGCAVTPPEYYGKMPEDGRGASLEYMQTKFFEYNNRGAGGIFFNSHPANYPREIRASKVDFPIASRQLQRTGLVSYMVYDKGSLVVDLTSPPDRFGDLLKADPHIYSMSLGKSLVGYFMGHAICQGHIESLDQKLSDWPLVADTFIADVSVKDVINASMGHHVFLKNNEEFHSGRFVGHTGADSLAIMITNENLEGTKADVKKYMYGQLPPFVALNYIAFKTGYEFKDFSDKILRDYVGLSSSLRWAHHMSVFQEYGVLHPNFNATREDTLRIGMSILEDWNTGTCVGDYLKDIYHNRASKSFEEQRGTGWGRAQAYAGFFHTDYKSTDDIIMGMDGYGGISMLINFDEERIVYAHSVARNYNHKRLIFDVITDGIEP